MEEVGAIVVDGSTELLVVGGGGGVLDVLGSSLVVGGGGGGEEEEEGVDGASVSGDLDEDEVSSSEPPLPPDPSNATM